MVKKILVTGFAHSGTTVLRAKIGECKNTAECPNESPTPPTFHPEMPFDFYVWKNPFLPTEIRNFGFSNKPNSFYADCIVIPIIRNPWNVFSSMYRKSKLTNNEFSIYDSRHAFSLPWYENACNVIAAAFENNYPDVYPIKYEEMFDNNFEKLRIILDKIGMQYDDDIFIKRTKDYIFNNTHLRPEHNNSLDYDRFDELRTWQINQPFKNMNADIDLPDDFSQMLANSPSVQKLGYSDPRITD